MIYHGGLLHVRLRYVDADGTTLELVNLGAVHPRRALRLRLDMRRLCHAPSYRQPS